MGWQWHHLDHMQIICTSLQTDNHDSTPSLNFLQAGCSFWCPTNSVKALKVNYTGSGYKSMLLVPCSLKNPAHLTETDWHILLCLYQYTTTEKYNVINLDIRCHSQSFTDRHLLLPFIQSISKRTLKHSRKSKPLKKWHEQRHLQSPLDSHSAVEVTRRLGQEAPVTSHHSRSVYIGIITCNLSVTISVRIEGSFHGTESSDICWW